MEFELIEEYNWTPAMINEIPYNKIKDIFLLKKVKNDEMNRKSAIESFKQKAHSNNKVRYR